jgi:ubiquinone/menaquinone biosynthesis C-methylase UbiE
LLLHYRIVNSAHNVLCSSGWWATRVRDKLIPFGLKDIDLGDEVLELGPGFGATTRLLVQRPGRLTAVELEPRYCEKLRRELGDAATIRQGDATALPFEDEQFSAVVCFTMLHHIPIREQQDRAFAEVARVLAPGGTFAGTDSIGAGAIFKLIHIGETLLLIDPEELPARLLAAGFERPEMQRADGTFRFCAHKPR